MYIYDDVYVYVYKYMLIGTRYVLTCECETIHETKENSGDADDEPRG